MNGWQTVRLVLWMLLLGLVSVAAYVFYGKQLYFCLFFSLGLIASIVAYIVYSCNRLAKKMFRMVESIRYRDFSLNYTIDEQGGWEARLKEEINEVMSQFRREVVEKEERHQYYETLLQIVDSCLLVIDKQGQILWMNRSAEQELCGHTLRRLEELNSLNKDFSEMINELRPGEVKVIRIYKEERMQDMAVAITDYSTTDAELRLVNLRNIRSVLEKNEMEAWQKLVRVLTHEIMNSITPIISLSDTLCERALQQGMAEDSIVLQGMQTIHRRSKGLLGFVDNYRKLSRLSSPVLAPVTVGELIGDIKKLFLSADVHYIYKVENEKLRLMVDRSQIEQVLINLLKNAGEACMEQPNPEVVLETSYQPEKHIFQLSVTDNGCGIMSNVLDKIFIPFFTTKPTGSGIGLSLCKQIMTLHGGSIRVVSEEGKGSCFTLKLVVK